MILAGLYLSYEGVEKALEYWHGDDEEVSPKKQISEKQRIWEASKIDAVLSIEIVILALASIEAVHWRDKLVSLAIVCYLITVLIYGAVALLVKIDDLGALIYHKTRFKSIGRGIIRSAPKIMGMIGFIGTAAMFLVGGSILVHNIEMLPHLQQDVMKLAPEYFSGMIETITSIVTAAIVGGVLVAIHSIFHKD